MMDSFFNPIVNSQIRKTEHTDTRQAIKRQEDKHHKRKKGREKPALEEDDETVVSVQSLKAFLNSLLNGDAAGTTAARGGAGAPDAADTSGLPEAPKMPPKPPAAVKAAQAYQHTSAYHDTPAAPPADRSAAPPAAGDDAQLSGKDRKVVAGLLQDLDLLLAHDIEELTIRKRGNLLDSILEIVSAHKALLKKK